MSLLRDTGRSSPAIAVTQRGPFPGDVAPERHPLPADRSPLSTVTKGTNNAPVTRPASGNPRTVPVTEGASASRENRRAIPVSCALHRGPRGFANLVVSTRGGAIVPNSHGADSCVVTLDEVAATVLFDLLGEWLG